MFVGRGAELEALNKRYASDTFECVVIYGRRRVGKTTLIKEFIKDKKAVYFVAREASGEINLTSFSTDTYSVLDKKLAGNAYFSDWEKAFAYLYEVAKEERIVVALDEYPYLAAGYKPISSILQAHIDEHFKSSKLFLILCGSSMSFMENQVMGYKSPLYGRRTAQLKITAFNFFEALPFFETFSPTDKAICYAVTGGIPEYLNKIDAEKSIESNITDLFLTSSGPLYEEPTNLLKQELREPATYNGIIEAIAQGASRLNEIATKCGLEANKCAKYLRTLITLGIVKKEFPITGESSKKSIYFLDDLMFRFWYRFVFPNMSTIASGLGGAVYDLEVEENLSAFMGLVFEEICKQYLVEETKRNATPFFLSTFGRWWGNNPKEKRQEEIDILAFRKGCALFCECKWTNALISTDVLNSLEKRSELFSYDSKWFWLFSKSGFTKSLIAEAENRSDVRLITFEDML